MATTMTPGTTPGEQYNAIFNAGGDTLAKAGASDKLRNRLVREEWARLGRQGWEAYRVENCHPWQLRIDLGELGIILVPPATESGPGALGIDMPRISMRDLGDANFTPLAVLPKELAGEVEKAYKDAGGVYSYPIGKCDSNGYVAFEKPAPFPQQVAEAKEQQFAWYRLEFRKALQSWSRYHQHQFITDRQRDAARLLHKSGDIAVLPEWVDVTRNVATIAHCPDCAEEIKPEAKVCRWCQSRWGGLTATEAIASGPAATGEALYGDAPAPGQVRQRPSPNAAQLEGLRKAREKRAELRAQAAKEEENPLEEI